VITLVIDERLLIVIVLLNLYILHTPTNPTGGTLFFIPRSFGSPKDLSSINQTAVSSGVRR